MSPGRTVTGFGADLTDPVDAAACVPVPLDRVIGSATAALPTAAAPDKKRRRVTWLVM
ncbi:putative secreted FAD-binding protein [Carbonactinospora thermoautotrophica]|uniref:Putative secreted FAD-binding protein n=1 Tax=Carbonactinospora thermoautotrophica TaxID=1469144 RepID=A0A132MUE5_9ACTN|nr:putative secreted FAD-binding protein [Carbonactinospora thermoautotrophica]